MSERSEHSLSAEQAAACGRRTVVKRDARGDPVMQADGETPVLTEEKIAAAEVLDWFEHDDGQVVVVTVAGEKLFGRRTLQ